MRRCLFILICFGFLSPAKAEEPLIVFAAASLAGPLDTVAENWGGDIAISYAGSALLARQITAGARADVVVLANADWMAHLSDAGAVDPDAVEPLLSNQIALVTRVSSGTPHSLLFPVNLAGLSEDARIATGFVDAVPVGIYARQALERIGEYDALRDRLVQVENARLALALVGRGDVEAALIYGSDARIDPRVRPIAWVNASLHDPILYPAAPLQNSDHPETAEFLDHLSSEASLQIFLDAGFSRVAE